MADKKKPTYEELEAELAKRKDETALSFKVSEKGGCSVYGLGRFPTTLYYEQWTKLIDGIEDLRKFIKENKSKMKMKE